MRREQFRLLRSWLTEHYIFSSLNNDLSLNMCHTPIYCSQAYLWYLECVFSSLLSRKYWKMKTQSIITQIINIVNLPSSRNQAEKKKRFQSVRRKLIYSKDYIISFISKIFSFIWNLWWDSIFNLIHNIK